MNEKEKSNKERPSGWLTLSLEECLKKTKYTYQNILKELYKCLFVGFIKIHFHQFVISFDKNLSDAYYVLVTDFTLVSKISKLFLPKT